MPTSISAHTTEPVSASDLTTILEFGDRSVIVDQERIRIGSSPVCEIRLNHGPLLHSVLCSEAGVLWIEADDQTTDLAVNDQICRRMALRNGDTVTVAGEDFTVTQKASASIQDDSDLTSLTAEELCDRILTEQAMVDEFDSSRLQGWQDLMTAIQNVDLDSIDNEIDIAEQERVSTAQCERLLEQIHEISAMMNGRSQELDACENELAAATSLLQETQDRVSQQIQEVLDQIGPRELRASA